MKKRIFWKIYWVLVLLSIFAILGIWYVLYDFLGVYENAQPVRKMDAVMTMFTEKNIDQILCYVDATYSEHKEADVRQFLVNKLADKNLIYTKAYGADSNNFPAFSVRDENGEICRVYLKAKEQRGRYDSKQWELDRIDNLIEKLDPIEIVAPEGYIVKVNGEVIGDSYVIDTTQVNDLENWKYLEPYREYIKLPQVVTYRLDELYLKPEICCETPDGQLQIERVSGTSGQVYQYDSICFEQMKEQYISQIERFTKTYVNYVTNDAEAADVLQYILPNTDLYRRMKTIEKTNVWTPKHSAVQFSDMEFSDYKTYGDKFYTCKVHFTYLIPYMMGDSEYDTWLHFYWVLQDDEWKIAEMFIE